MDMFVICAIGDLEFCGLLGVMELWRLGFETVSPASLRVTRELNTGRFRLTAKRKMLP